MAVYTKNKLFKVLKLGYIIEMGQIYCKVVPPSNQTRNAYLGLFINIGKIVFS